MVFDGLFRAFKAETLGLFAYSWSGYCCIMVFDRRFRAMMVVLEDRNFMLNFL